MSTKETLLALLPLFSDYYNVNTDNPEEPFVAEAVFSSHNEQYYLVKAAKVADINTKEYVYFAECDRLDDDELLHLDSIAWDRGISNARPGYDHRNTDVSLIVIAQDIDDYTKKLIKKTRHGKSYRFGLYGWSNYRLVAIECSSGTAYYNHMGRSFKKLVGNILNL